MDAQLSFRGLRGGNRMPLEYVLISPARDEAAYIERTIQSMIAQTRPPLRWIIVSDGSTDGTDEIVERYLPGRNWMQLLRLPPRQGRNFAAKVEAFNAGQAAVRHLCYDVIGNVDADVSFGADFFEFLLSRFEMTANLGVAGTHYVEGDFHSFRDSFINLHHVNGQCQLFRKVCFEDIGGYVPIPGGGIDWVAVTTARMKGWRTFSFSERTYRHHRKMGTAGTSELGARFHYGKKDYFLGGHPLWQIFRSAFQLSKKPYITGGVCLLLGYLWCWVRRVERPVSPELIRFHQAEQLARLRALVMQRFRPARRGAMQPPDSEAG